jgi:hypothetical protein
MDLAAANSFLEDGEHIQAAAIYVSLLKALSTWPGTPPVDETSVARIQHSLGTIYMRSHRPIDAAEMFRKLVETADQGRGGLSPDAVAGVYLDYGRCEQELTHIVAASELFKKVRDVIVL